jgi:nucleoside-diphosphate-sugar epimerase
MKTLVIGGNRFVGLRLSHLLDRLPDCQLHVLNRTGQVAHVKNATIYKGDRGNLPLSHLDSEWDLIYDFAGFTRQDAEASLNYFRRVGRYIFISTASVYDLGADVRETAFNAQTWDLNTPTPVGVDGGKVYQYGKRQAEAAFTQAGAFPVLCVRFPFILGPDDYTHRLNFHVQHARDGEPIYAANSDARFSVVHAQDAAEFLFRARDRQSTGSINVASRDPLTLRGLCAQIELISGHRARILPRPTNAAEYFADFSPYSPDHDWFLNVDRLQADGFTARPHAEWLPDLTGPPTNRGQVH